MNIANNLGNTALMVTSRSGNVQITKALLKTEAAVNKKNIYRKNALKIRLKSNKPAGYVSLLLYAAEEHLKPSELLQSLQFRQLDDGRCSCKR